MRKGSDTKLGRTRALGYKTFYSSSCALINLRTQSFPPPCTTLRSVSVATLSGVQGVAQSTPQPQERERGTGRDALAAHITSWNLLIS